MALLNNAICSATNSGSGPFSLGPAVQGALTPLLAGAINGSKYSYKAFLPDLSQWMDAIGTYTTLINPSFESVDSTTPGGNFGTSPLTLPAPPTFSNGDLIVAFLGVPVTSGLSPGTLGISGGGATWNVVGPFGPQSILGTWDEYWWMLWKVAASEPAHWTFSWNNSTGAWVEWPIAAFKTGGATPSLFAQNCSVNTNAGNSILAQSGLPGGIELRVMCEFAWALPITDTTTSADFISITPYTGDHAAFGYALYNNAASVPAIPNTSGSPVLQFSAGAVFTFSGAADTLAVDTILQSSNFNTAVSFPSPPNILFTTGAHEISSQPATIITSTSYVVQPTDTDLIYNGPAPGLITLLNASSYWWRQLTIRNITNFVVESASVNVLPASSQTPTNLILPGTAGVFADLKSNGSNWLTERTNVGLFGTPVAGGVFEWPNPLPSNDIVLDANVITSTFANPFTSSVNIGAIKSPFLLVPLTTAISTDTVTIGGVTVPWTKSAALGSVFAGRATGLTGSQTLSTTVGTWGETGIGVFASNFDLVVQNVLGATAALTGDIVCAANSILLGVVLGWGTSNAGPPGSIDFTGSTALPTSRNDTSFDATGNNSTRALQSCCAIWNISSAGNFHVAMASSGSFPPGITYLLVNVTLAPAAPKFFPNIPVTITGSTYTVQPGDATLIANKSGGVTLTLPAATGSGRQIRVKTITNDAVVSNASNVVPLAGGAAGTAIVSNTAGKWADLQDDPTTSDWVIMASN